MAEKELPLEGHLEEIRKRILIVFFCLFFFSGVAFYFIHDILTLLKWPAGDDLGTLAVFSPTAAILSFIKIALTGGLIATLPVFLYQVWMFIRPALNEKFSREGGLFIVAGSLLFMLGVTFSYFVLVPASLQFLLSLGRGELEFIISLDSYVSFVLLFLLAGGLVFEMPMFVFMLARFGVLTARRMIAGWRVAVVFILIASAVLTPTPDLFNMMIMAAPMVVLYILSIFVARLAETKEPRALTHSK